MRIFCGILLFLLVLILFPSHQLAFCGSAPDFTLTDIDGSAFNLRDFLGQVVVLDFFATWCHPCMDEIPILKDVKDQFPQGLALISISVDPVTDTVENLLAFRNDYNVTWIVTRDTIGISDVYNVTAIPTIYIIDNAGDIAYRRVGTTEASVIIAQLTPLVPEYPFQIILLVMVFTTTIVAFAKKHKFPFDFCNQRTKHNTEKRT